MTEEAGFLDTNPEVGEPESALPRDRREAGDDPAHGAVTREVLDVARYITDVTAQLETVAIAAHLDQLAYFLGMAKAESETCFASTASSNAQRAEDVSHEPTVGLHHENNSFD